MNLESMKVNLTTVIAIVVASFSLYFFVAALIAAAIIETKIFALDIDIGNKQDIVSMYRFQQLNGIAKADTQSRIESLEAQIARRDQEKIDIRSGK